MVTIEKFFEYYVRTWTPKGEHNKTEIYSSLNNALDRAAAIVREQKQEPTGDKMFDFINNLVCIEPMVLEEIARLFGGY